VVNENLGVIGFQDSIASAVPLPTGADSTVAGLVAVADLRGSSAQEFIVPIGGASSLPIYGVSGAYPRGGVNSLQPVLLQDLILPGDATINRGAMFIDIDSDGDQDILLALTTAVGDRLFVATNTQNAN